MHFKEFLQCHTIRATEIVIFAVTEIFEKRHTIRAYENVFFVRTKGSSRQKKCSTGIHRKTLMTEKYDLHKGIPVHNNLEGNASGPDP